MNSFLKMHEFASARGDGLRPEMLRILERATEESVRSSLADGVAADRPRIRLVASTIPEAFPHYLRDGNLASQPSAEMSSSPTGTPAG